MMEENIKGTLYITAVVDLYNAVLEIIFLKQAYIS